MAQIALGSDVRGKAPMQQKNKGWRSLAKGHVEQSEVCIEYVLWQ